VLEKEFERAGIPAVLITALLPVARTLHVNRLVAGVGITHPLGDPLVSRAEEKAIRRRILDKALDMLARPVGEEKAKGRES
jgi:glycine reductase complex component B subunit gamma